MNRVTAGSVLLAACGLASLADPAHAAGGDGLGASALSGRVARLAYLAEPVDRAASVLKSELPQEATGQVYLR
ncbi:hypothetical protein AB0F13_17580 [Streptomyces sp. NPDC026206]|uniref:hypothetical protein n=1 Tax=Streptomyces sp. NPDC026206 TaxID=3157089 RepID=UPI0033DEB24E